MRLGGRLAAAIEVLEDIEKRRRPAADALKDWGLSHRFAGAGDRADVDGRDQAGRDQSLAQIVDEGRAIGIAFVEAGLRYTRLVVENAGLMTGYWKKPDAAVATKVRENWKLLEAVAAEQPYAINPSPVRPP